MYLSVWYMVHAHVGVAMDKGDNESGGEIFECHGLKLLNAFVLSSEDFYLVPVNGSTSIITWQCYT